LFLFIERVCFIVRLGCGRGNIVSGHGTQHRGFPRLLERRSGRLARYPSFCHIFAGIIALGGLASGSKKAPPEFHE